MSINIQNAFGRLCFLTLALVLFFPSCTDEFSSEMGPSGGSKGEESEVTLKLQLPGSSADAKTRAVTEEEENEIDDLYVLAFKVDKDNNEETFDYYVAAKKLSTAGTSGELSTWTANLKVKNYRQTFVMIANAQGTPGKVNEQIGTLAGNSVGHSKMPMLAKLTDILSEDEKNKGFNAAAPGNHHPFTMYGQTATTLITENGGHNLTVSMHRIMAQVRLTFTGDAADDTQFEAESVSLYNFNDRARVIPDNLGVTGKDYVKTPTIPQGAVLLPAKVDGKESVPTYTVNKTAKKIEHAIYLFETAQPEVGTELEKHVKRPCLIVKGRYQQEAKSCYYRVDFAETAPTGGMTYMDVMRNHSYNVTVSNVTGRGHDTPQEALLSKPANITATVVAWNDTEMGDLDFDGRYVLGIGTMKYQLNKRGGKDLLQQVKASVGLEWTATLYEADEFGQPTNNTLDWIRFVNPDGSTTLTISGKGTNNLNDQKFIVDQNENVPERRAVMRFTARNLKVDALVVQDQSNPVYIDVKIDGRIITEEEFEQLGGWCREMTIEYGPENTELTWKYISRGVQLSQTDVGAGATTDMAGSASSGNTVDASISWKGNALPLTGLDNLDYATVDGVLTLIAKGQQGMEAKSIRLFQKKYGVTLETHTVPCTGEARTVRVRGNMPWTAEMDAQNMTDAVNGGYLKSVSGSWSGTPTEQYVNGQWLTFNTAQQDVKKGNMSAVITFKHATNDRIDPMDKEIRLTGCLVVPGYPSPTLYEVYGPVYRSYNTKADPYKLDDGTIVQGAAIIDRRSAEWLTNYGGIDDYGIGRETTFTSGYTIHTAAEDPNTTPFGAVGSSHTYRVFDDTKGQGSQTHYITALTKKIDTRYFETEVVAGAKIARLQFVNYPKYTNTTQKYWLCELDLKNYLFSTGWVSGQYHTNYNNKPKLVSVTDLPTGDPDLPPDMTYYMADFATPPAHIRGSNIRYSAVLQSQHWNDHSSSSSNFIRYRIDKLGTMIEPASSFYNTEYKTYYLKPIN